MSVGVGRRRNGSVESFLEDRNPCISKSIPVVRNVKAIFWNEALESIFLEFWNRKLDQCKRVTDLAFNIRFNFTAAIVLTIERQSRTTSRPNIS